MIDDYEPKVTPDSVTVGRYVDADANGKPDYLTDEAAEVAPQLVSIPPLARTVIYYVLAIANGVAVPLAAAGKIDGLVVLIILNFASVMGFTLAANRVPAA